MSEGQVWDLRVYGEPVETVDDLLHWLNAHRKDRSAQEEALARFVAVSRREIPEALAEELRSWLPAPVE
jgi:hypothetical protein